MHASCCTTIKHFCVGFLLSCGFVSFLVGNPAAAQGDAPLKVTISTVSQVPLEGQMLAVPVMFQGDENYPLGAFVFSIRIDPNILTFDHVEPGRLFIDCEWGHLGAGADSAAIVKVLGVADPFSGPEFPACYLASSVEDTLFLLYFTVSSDTSFNCQFTPLEFFWEGCNLNEFSDDLGLTSYVENSVYDAAAAAYRTRPDTVGTTDGLPDGCVGATTLRTVDFVTGGVDFECIAPPYLIGDINLNQIPYEIADLVLFTNYFLYGSDVFSTNPEYQIAASDMNYDGEVLTLRDYAVLWRVVTGESEPPTKTAARPQVLSTAFFEHDSIQEQVSFSYPEPLCVLHVEFLGEIVPTAIPSSGIILEWSQDAGHTQVLIRGEYSGTIDGINPGPVFSYTGTGTIESIEVADWMDREVQVAMGPQPDCGDANNDGVISLADAVAVISYIFGGGSIIPEAADADCSGNVSVGDAVSVIIYIFGGGPAPCAACQ